MIASIIKLFTKTSDKINITDHNDDMVLIDVRTPFEYNMGHLESSINIPLGNISDHIQDFKHAGKKIVLVCRSGARSGQAADLLKSNGINAINGSAWNSYEG